MPLAGEYGRPQEAKLPDVIPAVSVFGAHSDSSPPQNLIKHKKRTGTNHYFQLLVDRAVQIVWATDLQPGELVMGSVNYPEVQSFRPERGGELEMMVEDTTSC